MHKYCQKKKWPLTLWLMFKLKDCFWLTLAKLLLVNMSLKSFCAFKSVPDFNYLFVAESHKSDFTYCDVRLTLIKEQTQSVA